MGNSGLGAGMLVTDKVVVSVVMNADGGNHRVIPQRRSGYLVARRIAGESSVRSDRVAGIEPANALGSSLNLLFLVDFLVAAILALGLGMVPMATLVVDDMGLLVTVVVISSLRLHSVHQCKYYY